MNGQYWYDRRKSGRFGSACLTLGWCFPPGRAGREAEVAPPLRNLTHLTTSQPSSTTKHLNRKKVKKRRREEEGWEKHRGERGRGRGCRSDQEGGYSPEEGIRGEPQHERGFSYFPVSLFARPDGQSLWFIWKTPTDFTPSLAYTEGLVWRIENTSFGVRRVFFVCRCICKALIMQPHHWLDLAESLLSIYSL